MFLPVCEIVQARMERHRTRAEFKEQVYKVASPPNKMRWRCEWMKKRWNRFSITCSTVPSSILRQVAVSRCGLQSLSQQAIFNERNAPSADSIDR